LTVSAAGDQFRRRAAGEIHGGGFVGKGDVQTALGYNNSALQKAVDAMSLVFTAAQPTSQMLTESISKSGKQIGTQTVVQLPPRPARSPPRRSWSRI
jgi:hypothetical protein